MHKKYLPVRHGILHKMEKQIVSIYITNLYYFLYIGDSRTQQNKVGIIKQFVLYWLRSGCSLMLNWSFLRNISSVNVWSFRKYEINVYFRRQLYTEMYILQFVTENTSLVYLNTLFYFEYSTCAVLFSLNTTDINGSKLENYVHIHFNKYVGSH